MRLIILGRPGGRKEADLLVRLLLADPHEGQAKQLGYLATDVAKQVFEPQPLLDLPVDFVKELFDTQGADLVGDVDGVNGDLFNLAPP